MIGGGGGALSCSENSRHPLRLDPTGSRMGMPEPETTMTNDAVPSPELYNECDHSKNSLQLRAQLFKLAALFLRAYITYRVP